MTVLVVGGGGREHAVVDSLSKSPHVNEIHCAPGNGGISQSATCHDVKATDLNGMVKLAKEIKADYVFVASDDPLVLGMVDEMEANGFKTFGPRKNAAVIEGSKVFSKAFMKRHGIPTAAYETFSDADNAISFIKERNQYPIVIKCDGLALGKGAVIAKDFSQAEKVVSEIMLDGKFGGSGREIVVEEFMSGVEVTVLAFTDGKTVYPMIASTDHKRAFDGDKGLNTGGMGVIAPTPYYTKRHETECLEKIIKPTIQGLDEEGRPFKGCLYFELMITADEIKVIEYNCRFGDPEAQTILPLLKTDLFEIMEAIDEERLCDIKLEWHEKCAACVVMASGGYPEKYETGKLISGLDRLERDCNPVQNCSENSKPEKIDKTNSTGNAIIYHAGTRIEDGNYYTSGGRVLGVTGIGGTLDEALYNAYSAVGIIMFENVCFRRDIGKKALDYIKG